MRCNVVCMHENMMLAGLASKQLVGWQLVDRPQVRSGPRRTPRHLAHPGAWHSVARLRAWWRTIHPTILITTLHTYIRTCTQACARWNGLVEI